MRNVNVRCKEGVGLHRASFKQGAGGSMVQGLNLELRRHHWDRTGDMVRAFHGESIWGALWDAVSWGTALKADLFVASHW